MCWFFFFCFLGPSPWHMEVPRLGVQLKLQLLAYNTAIAMPDPSHICDLYHSSWQRWILNPLRPGFKRATSWFLVRFGNHCATKGTPPFKIFNTLYFILFIFYFCLFAISWAAPAAYGGSQARGLIGAAAAGLPQSHSNAGSEPHLQPTPRSRQRRIVLTR